ncbi:pitrilysin family protein [Duganella sp. Root336D2]|uniref:M16 family metallopeptidase n=1 Tax=Duganella sp. Root336D2 TaxID=1736518 RepID=UPI0006F1E7F0|nr:pitrilysin family protein [Duganella sp. Root336D2]KQV55086.1 Zn-dependent peptidase [Duganella sp. Root336D2]
MKLMTIIALAACLQAPAGAADGVQRGATLEGITEYRLENGLRVLLAPDQSRPTVTTNIVYQVGSRHENYGETGMAHLLEHLLFRPSQKFSGKDGAPTPLELLNSIGARFNGSTWYDRTSYHATFPASAGNLARMLELEADRMRGAALARDDLWNPATGKGEMTVVRNEFEMAESDPLRVTGERVRAVAYDWHNYGKAAIGTRSDIEQVEVERLRAFYQRYYQPDNAVLVVAGQFEEQAALRQVQQAFGALPRPARVLAPTYTVEPVQDGERSVTVRRSGGVQLVSAGYHVAPAAHSDGAALEILLRILSDAPGGRLHQGLVATGLASKLQVVDSATREPGFLQLGAVVGKDAALEPAQDALLRVLEGMRAQPVTEAEVARARQQLLKSFEQAANDTTRLSLALTDAVAAGDWRLFFLQRERIAKVDAAAVQAVAEKYFKPSNRTLGRFIPTEQADRVTVPTDTGLAAALQDYHGRPALRQGEAFEATPAAIEGRLERLALANGMQAALLAKTTKGGAVHAVFKLRLGSQASLQDRAEVGPMAAALLAMGTQSRSRQQLRDALDALQASVSFQGGVDSVTVSVQTVREALPAVLELVAEQLQKPAYPEQEFLQYRRERVARTEQAAGEPQALAGNAVQRLLNPFPPGHPLHVPALPDSAAAQQAVTLQQVRDFHRQHYGAQDASVAVVGDFDAAHLKARLAALFGNWRAAQPYVRMARAYQAAPGARVQVETPDKANSVLLAAYPLAMRDDDAAFPALLMANYMLGGGAMRSRLADRIRQQDGLSYAVNAQLMVPARDSAGLWLATAMSAPHNSAKVEAALLEELGRAAQQGFTQAELEAAKRAWGQARQVARNADAGLAGMLSEYLALGRTMEFDRALEARVAALTVAEVNQAAARLPGAGAGLALVKAGDFRPSMLAQRVQGSADVHP